MKKLLAIILVAVTVLSSFGFTVFADEYGMPFADVKEGAWYYEGIEFCYNFGIVSGMTETTFQPNGTLTRAQFVQMLAMYDGVDLEEYKTKDSGFTDVKTNHWFNAPVCWAVENGYVSGMSETRFGPNEKITREQLARLFYLYAESVGCDVSYLADLSVYEDESKVSDWAYTQVQWAVGAGIISGTSDTTLSARATATRAQSCRMMMTFNDFYWYGYRDTSGAYRVIADYILANGESFEGSPCVSVTEAYEDYCLSLEYDTRDDLLYFYYMSDYYEGVDGDVEFSGYRTWADMSAFSLSSEYGFTYYYEAENGDNMYSDGLMFIDRYEEYGNEVVGFDAETCTANAVAITEILRDRIAAILAEADMSLEDFFLPEENETDETYDALVQYVCENGEEAPFGGSVFMYTDEGDRAYITECVTETGELCFIYVSEPLPDGTDIYDTSYREHAIILLNSTVDDGYVVYTYENEDEGKNITVEGSFDGIEITLGDIDATGFSKEDAQTKAQTALSEVLGYFNDVLNAAVNGEPDPVYDALVQYVCENGEEAPFGGSIVIYTYEGDKAYVAEYVPETGELCFVYAADPIPGGTDVYDTEYREHAILLLDATLGDDFFLYTYASEDATSAIIASGTTDRNTLNVEELVYDGISEGEATAMMEGAMSEVVTYSFEILSLATETV